MSPFLQGLFWYNFVIIEIFVIRILLQCSLGDYIFPMFRVGSYFIRFHLSSEPKMQEKNPARIFLGCLVTGKREPKNDNLVWICGYVRSLMHRGSIL